MYPPTQGLFLKMIGSTARSDQHLCPTCNYGYVRRGVTAKTDVQVCTALGRTIDPTIKDKVVDCSHYYNRTLPTLHDFEQVAWEITTKGNKIGFISPDDRRKAGIGFGER